MRHGKRAAVIVGAVAVAALALAGASPAAAQGRRGGHAFGHPGFRGGFYAGPRYYYAPWFGFGYDPFFAWGWGYPGYWGYPGPGPYYYGRPGVDMNAAMIAGYGAVDMDVKPKEAEVWVDGEYMGEARDLHGDPTYLWLKKGPHRIEVYRGGYRTFDEKIDVGRGMMRKLKVRLEPGQSTPPGPRPDGRRNDGDRKSGEKGSVS